jgi:hypothetical protein
MRIGGFHSYFGLSSLKVVWLVGYRLVPGMLWFGRTFFILFFVVFGVGGYF